VKVLVWQWGRRGGGPRVALELAEAMRQLPGIQGLLSLSERAEILASPSPPVCDMLVATYGSMAGFVWRLVQAPAFVLWLDRQLRALRPDLAVCAMPGPLDILMLAALRLRRIPVVILVHDADPHPGDILPVMIKLQRVIVRRADALVTLSAHVADRLREQGLVRPGVPLAVIAHPPRHFGPLPPPPFAHDGPVRLLFFGRLLAYKGLDLLADALRLIGPEAGIETRIVGSGPESPALDALRALPGVAVENRWVPEDEIGPIVAWSDALVLPYREASQSGAAAAAIAARRYIVATRVGGLIEQLKDDPLAQLCDPEPNALAAALKALTKQRVTTTPGSPYREDTAQSWSHFARAVLDLAVGASGAAGTPLQR
jgi:glycosyltransferase involved in cell wall biosynthesis